ncbi:MAG: zinc ABC transporter substrate-binding protein [Chloroflexi bacterium]|nr:MAG: zinc ABC transporter substrate-binding protein [Chloroflexota bacterium]MBL1194513.1 zinc ABC transporter substrate-binding protein [Chloroflexota bacterium]NOH11801.1 zinc ABC transporter substrate-binding protein [Chloroflexota bacterium]
MDFRKIGLMIFGFAAFLLSACAAQDEPSWKIGVVATTNIVGDVVAQIGGEHVELTVMLPVDADPHSFQPTPQDLVAVENADIVFVNGLDLEEFLAEMVENVGGEDNIVSVSEEVATIEFSGGHDDHEEGEEHDDHEEGEEHEEHEHSGADPHVWMDPNNVKIWTDNIATALSTSDPDNAATYVANAEAYNLELDELDEWAQSELAQLASENRVLVTDHEALGYFAEHYGFEIIGTILPGSSTLAEPSASELAALEDLVVDFGVPAIFVGTTVNPNLAQRVADDTGVQLVPLYTGSLSDADGPAATYLEMMRYNVGAIVEALQ